MQYTISEISHAFNVVIEKLYTLYQYATISKICRSMQIPLNAICFIYDALPSTRTMSICVESLEDQSSRSKNNLLYLSWNNILQCKAFSFQQIREYIETLRHKGWMPTEEIISHF